MVKSLNQFIKLLFILILVARISVSQPKESKDATKCATKCVNDIEKLAQLKQACKTMTMSKCSSHFDARTERTPKSSRKCFRVNTHRSSTKSGAHSVQKRDTTKQNITNTPRANTTNFFPNTTNTNRQHAPTPYMSPNSTKPSTTTTQPSKQNTSHTSSTLSTAFMIPKTFFEHWENACYVAAGGLVLILGIVAVVLFKYCKRKNSGSKLTPTMEVRSVSPTSTLGQSAEVESASPEYCEADIFTQFPSKEPRSETAETVKTEVNEPTDVESNSEDEYYYPENIEDVYENMSPVNPPQASGEYACAYDYLNINEDYVNTFPHQQPTNGVEDDYEYPQNSRSSSDNEYHYAYDWLDPGFRVATLSSSEPVLGYTPLDKDEVDDNVYENCQTLSRTSLEKENEMVPLEYVTVLEMVPLEYVTVL